MGNTSSHKPTYRRDGALRRFKANGGGSSSFKIGTVRTSSSTKTATASATGVSEVVVPNGLTVIQGKAFFHNTTLRHIRIPSSVTRIRFSAFEQCQALLSVDFSPAVDGKLKAIEIQAFYQCTSLKQIRIPSSVETIGIGAFAKCTSLVVVDFSPAKAAAAGGTQQGLGQPQLQRIGSMAFSDCTSLLTIDIPSSVSNIAARAFANCSQLVEAYLPNGLQRMEDGLFASCSRLERIRIPSTVQTIRREAFANCTSLVQVDLPSALQTLEPLAFWKCFSLRAMCLPPTLGSIGFLSFAQCHRLTKATLPEGLTAIHIGCFEDCTVLHYVSTPSSMRKIHERAFAGCNSLQVVDLAEGLQRIGESAFQDCYLLAAIRIPSTVESLAYHAFGNCRSLITAEISSKCTVDINDGAFGGCQSLVNIIVPPLMKEPKSCSQVDASWQFQDCDILQQQCDSWRKPQLLVTRFYSHPIHAKCYHASETTLYELEQTIESFEWKHDRELLDSFGMTPFHVLFASWQTRTDLANLLLEVLPSSLLDWKDNTGKRAEEYLNAVWGGDGSLELMGQVLRKRLLDRLLQWGMESWRANVEHKIHRLLDADGKSSRQKHLRSLNVLMKRYQRIESVALLELWLWKQQIQSELADECWTQERGLDRESCLARCGFSFIYPTVFEFLG